MAQARTGTQLHPCSGAGLQVDAGLGLQVAVASCVSPQRRERQCCLPARQESLEGKAAKRADMDSHGAIEAPQPLPDQGSCTAGGIAAAQGALLRRRQAFPMSAKLLDPHWHAKRMR